ncbi:hypothetical protein CEE45_05205 [Candidatus Heimdallarchaeota archaeon B3_Heim]|nr:MAG: hypothetical protein CEE45_05205 [Candidatus Heimdallarchaeota archaeon B3_Heim]
MSRMEHHNPTNKKLLEIKEIKLTFLDYGVQVNRGIKRDITRHIAKYYGHNIRARERIYDSQYNRYAVPLDAILLNEVRAYSGKTKFFQISLKNVGSIIITDEEKIDRSATTSPANLNSAIKQKFWAFREDLSSFILKEKQDIWGKIPRIATFMNPLFVAINRLVNYQEVPVSFWKQLEEEKETKHWKYIQLLSQLSKSYVVIKDGKTFIGEELERLIEKYQDSSKVSEVVAGIIYAERLQDLVHDFQLRSIANYVYLPRTYYSDALDYGENIRVPEKHLLRKHFLNNSRGTYQEKHMIYLENTLSELVNRKCLEKEEKNKKKVVFGEEDLWQRLYNHREQVLGQVEVAEVIS